MIARLGLSERDRRTLTIGLMTVMSLVTLSRGIPALRVWEAGRLAAAGASSQQLSVVRQAERDHSRIRDSLRARQRRLAELDSSLLTGPSPSTILAVLASSVEALAEENGFKVGSVRLRADSLAMDGLALVEARVAGVTDVAGLAGFLRAVESGKTVLVVRDLSVSQPEPAASDAKPEALRVDMLIASIGLISTGTRP